MAKEDLQHRVRLLLQEALPMLCRSGLAQTSEFSVEALIGITLNKDDVFLVSIKETVKSDGSVLSKSANHESKANEPERNQRKKTPRKRKHSKSVKSSYSEESENASDLDTDHPDSAKRDRLDMSQDDESCPNPDYPSSETHRGDSENEDDSQEAVIVKEEPGVAFNTSGGGSTADQSFATNSFSRFGASSVHLQPPRVDATSPARLSQSLPLPGTSFSHSPNSQQAAALLETQAALAQGSMEPDDYMRWAGSGRWRCELCGKVSQWKTSLRRHILGAHFRLVRFRCVCGSEFKWNRKHYTKHCERCPMARALGEAPGGEFGELSVVYGYPEPLAAELEGGQNSDGTGEHVGKQGTIEGEPDRVQTKQGGIAGNQGRVRSSEDTITEEQEGERGNFEDIADKQSRTLSNQGIAVDDQNSAGVDRDKVSVNKAEEGAPGGQRALGVAMRRTQESGVIGLSMEDVEKVVKKEAV